ncbi:protein LNK1 isoform X2 [Sesamum indicum]|uniref:Protein LNK1 isoform X2 n=1 Tax=Sesamum indicum TaxID=4182 RepID=A0A8M8V2I0_SESIN|nr:protein LNK1 isoform X2 [Sesamum indicum]
MSDLCMYNFEGIAWDEFCFSGDHIVPHPGSKRLDEHFILGESHKKPRRELTSSSDYSGDRSVEGYVDQGREQGGFSSLSKRRNSMLEKDSWPLPKNRAFTSESDSDPAEASSLTSANSMPSSRSLKINSAGFDVCGHNSILGDKTSIVDNNSFSYPLGGINQNGCDLNFFENAENKDSSEFLCYGWPEIGNFEDVDRMFSCDSTFGLGVSKEDELGWLSSTDDLGGCGDLLKLDVKFPCPEPNVMEKISENHDSSKVYSTNDSAMTTPIGYKNSSSNSAKTDSYTSFVIEPAPLDRKDGFIPHRQGGANGKIQPAISINSPSRTGGASMNNMQTKQINLQNHSGARSNEGYLANGTFSHISGLANEVMQLPSHQAFRSVHLEQQQDAPFPDSCNYLQNPISYVCSDNSHLSDPASVNVKPSSVKSETNGLTSVLPRDSSHTTPQVQCTESFRDPPFEVSALATCEQGERQHSCQSSRSLMDSGLENGNVTLQASMFNPFSVGKYENHSDPEGGSSGTPAELGSLNIQERAALDDISLEAATFRQLQLVMERLDLRTKLCIRDSLYRLAQSAEQRHNHANLHAGCGDKRDATNEASVAEGTDKCTGFMDMETNTNPIDRSIAHLLFHRPSGQSNPPPHDSSRSKSSSAVHGSVASPPVWAENLVGKETFFEVEKVS